MKLSTLYTAIAAMTASITLQLFSGCSEEHSPSNGNMKQQAEAAITEVGGVDALGKEAKFILSNLKAGSDWNIPSSGTNCPAITKLDSLLSPQKADAWVVGDQKNLPAHVVIRFGSHANYRYVWIFDPEHMPAGKMEGIENLGGAVYLSQKNQ